MIIFKVLMYLCMAGMVSTTIMAFIAKESKDEEDHKKMVRAGAVCLAATILTGFTGGITAAALAFEGITPILF